MNVRIGSWHYRLAVVYGGLAYWRQTDICQYTRRLLWGLIKCVAIICLSSALLYGPMTAAIVAWLHLGVADFGEAAVLVLFVEAIAVAGFVVYLALHGVAWLLDRVYWEERAPKEPGAVRQMYRAWRDKYCARVEFTEGP